MQREPAPSRRPVNLSYSIRDRSQGCRAVKGNASAFTWESAGRVTGTRRLPKQDDRSTIYARTHVSPPTLMTLNAAQQDPPSSTA